MHISNLESETISFCPRGKLGCFIFTFYQTLLVPVLVYNVYKY